MVGVFIGRGVGFELARLLLRPPYQSLTDTVLFAFIPGLLAIHALRIGTGFWRFGLVDREETPLFFSVYMAPNIAAALGLVSMML